MNTGDGVALGLSLLAVAIIVAAFIIGADLVTAGDAIRAGLLRFGDEKKSLDKPPDLK